VRFYPETAIGPFGSFGSQVRIQRSLKYRRFSTRNETSGAKRMETRPVGELESIGAKIPQDITKKTRAAFSFLRKNAIIPAGSASSLIWAENMIKYQTEIKKMNEHGGHRQGAGRPAGSPNRATVDARLGCLSWPDFYALKTWSAKPCASSWGHGMGGRHGRRNP
jgi:hypothetical protein